MANDRGLAFPPGNSLSNGPAHRVHLLQIESCAADTTASRERASSPERARATETSRRNLTFVDALTAQPRAGERRAIA